MKFVGLLSLVCVFCLAVTLFTPEIEAKLKKLKIAKKVGKLLLLRGVTRPRVVLADDWGNNLVVLAVPVPLPIPLPIIRKTVNNPISADSWGSAPAHTSTSYEIPSLASLPHSILELLRPALSTIAASALRGGSQAWSVGNSLPLEAAWPSVSSVESSWSSGAPVAQSAYSSNSNNIQQQQQVVQEVVEQQQTNNYA